MPAKRGGYDLRLTAPERDLLRSLAPEMRAILLDGSDPALSRLFPSAYPDDPELEEEWREISHDQLVEGHLSSLAVLEEHVDAEHLDEDQLSAWMRAINQVRLLFGTRLEVTEEREELQFDSDDPRTAALEIYDYLSWLQEDVVAALAERSEPGRG